MGNGPEDHWYPWLKRELERKGYEVWVPQLPETDNPSIAVWVPYILEKGKFTEETVVIGHSAGAAVILALLEEVPVKVKQAILVAGFYSYPGGDPIVKPEYDWTKIRTKAEEIVFINSDNDPYGYDDAMGKQMLSKLNMDGAVQITLKGQGHMGTEEFGQEYKEFPLLSRFVV